MKLRNVIKDFIVCSSGCIYERFAIQFRTNLNFNSYKNDADFCICVIALTEGLLLYNFPQMFLV